MADEHYQVCSFCCLKQSRDQLITAAIKSICRTCVTLLSHERNEASGLGKYSPQATDSICSFCGGTSVNVQPLFQGQNRTHICNICVGLAVEILADRQQV